MSSFSRFQERNKSYQKAQAEVNTHFLIKGYPSIKITSDQNEKQAVVVNKQEKDMAYVYTNVNDGLEIGSIWTAKTLHLLIAEEIVIIKDVNWRKYIALLCNVELENTWGYFVGLKKRYSEVSEERLATIESRQKPLLVLPANILEFEDTVVIHGRPWLVQEYDSISEPGLVYYSLAPTTAPSTAPNTRGVMRDSYIIKKQSQTTDLILEPVEDPETNNKLIAYNQDITVETEQGYFKYSDKGIQIKKHTSTEVVFCLPFGVKEVTIEVKGKGEVKQEHFVVVE